MAYGLKIVNPSGQLVISSNARGLVCVGRATLVSITYPSGLAGSAPPGRTGGYLTYTYTHVDASRIEFAHECPLGDRVGIFETTQSGNTWTITAYCGNTPDADGFDTVLHDFGVWAFAQVSGSPAGQFGLAIYDSAGNLAYDLSHAYPLFPRQLIATAGSENTNTAIANLYTVVALGANRMVKFTESLVTTKTWQISKYRAGYKRTSATNIQNVHIIQQRYRIISDTQPGIESGADQPTTSFLLEGLLLP